MKLPRQKRDETSAAITPTLGLIVICSGLFVLTAYASDPSWWSSTGTGTQSAVIYPPQVVTNSGIVTTNYVRNDYAAVTQGQLKHFTIRAVDDLNATLPAGAGSNLDTMVSNWAQDYLTNGYATNPANPTLPYKPSDLQAENVGQLKYIGNMVWGRLVAAGYTNALPSWVAVNTNTDNAVANLGQLKEVFDFDLSTWGSPYQITSAATVTTAVDTTFDYAITAPYNPTNFSATNLPSGLTLNATTGVISGTNATTGIYSINLSATGASGTDTGVLVIDVTSSSAAPVINSPTAALATVGLPVTYQITASNNPTLFGASGLPTGLSLNPATGAISGTVTTATNCTISLSASNGSGTGTGVLNLAVNSSGGEAGGAAPVITSSLTVNATNDVPFSYTITASNSPTSYDAISLPSGLNINTSNGLISGTPTTGGNYSVLISATNSSGTTTALLNLTISAITSPLTASTIVGIPFTYTITTTINSPSFTVSTLPDGLSFSTTNGIGIISGTATEPGTTNVMIEATGSGLTATATLTLTLDAAPTTTPVITSPTTDTASLGSYYIYPIMALNGPTSYNATWQGGTLLPAGLVLDPTTGIISGTPTTGGTFTIDLTATNAQGPGTSTLTLTVSFAGTAPAPVITSPNIAYATNGIPFTYATTVSNGTASFTFSGLPTGLTTNSTPGVITGTPTAVGTPTITITATNAFGTTTMPLLLVIQSATNTITATMNLQDGISPWATYQTISAGIATDSTNANIALQPNPNAPWLDVGMVTPTQTDRILLGFDLSPLPPGATITSASLILYAVPTTSTSSTNTYTLDLDTPTNAFTPSTASWTNSDFTTNDVLSSISATLPTTATSEAWPTSTNFVAAVQDAYNAGSELNLLVWSPTLESGTNVNYFGFENEQDGVPPKLSLSYTTSAPPVIAVPPPAVITPGSTFNYQVTAINTNTNTTYSETGLPSGLSISSTTGDFLGSSTNSGVYTVTVTATNDNGQGTTTFTLAIGNPPVITSPTTTNATVNSSFSYNIAASNTTTSDALPTYFASNLPAGLTLDPSTGVISGTPTVAVTTEVTIGVTTSYGTASSVLTITFAPIINSPLTAASGNLGIPFSYWVWASNSPTNFSASGLPAGLSINSFGNITGTADLSDSIGSYQATITATNSAGTSASVNLGITLAGVPVINAPLTAASGNLNTPFRYTVMASNSPTSFSETGLPSGLSLNTTNGVISGTPTATGTSTVTLSATNAAGPSSSATLTITIAGTPIPTVGNQSTGWVVDVPDFYYSASYLPVTYNPPLGSNSQPSLSYTIDSNTLPAGLTTDGSGDICGMPTAAGSDAVGVTVTESLGNSATGTINLVIFSAGPGLYGPFTANADVGCYFSYSLSPVQPDATSTSATNLPAGLTYTDYSNSSYGSYGYISGTPTTPGTYNVTLSATDPSGTSTNTLVLTVGSSLITSSNTLTEYVGESFNFSVIDDNMPTNFQASNLPPGLSINPTTGVISGTPVAADTVPIDLTVTDAVGTETSTLLLTIEPNPSDTQIDFQQGESPTASYTVPSAIIANDTTNTAIANETFSTSNVLTVGQTTATASSRALLAFNLSALPPNATIVGASLALNTSSGNSAGAPLAVGLYQSSGSFASGSATWTSNSGYNSTVLGSVTLNPSVSAPYTFPISSALAQAVQLSYNSSSDLYLTLAAPAAEQGGTPDYVGIVTNASNPGQNPELMVTYTLATPGAPVITSATTVTGTVNVSVNYTITANNNPQTFAATALPSGLSVNTTNGVISGTVSTVGSTVATVSATNSIGIGSQAVTFNIDSATPATSLLVISGSNQVSAPGTFLSAPLVVQANYSGTNLPNALVTFRVPPGEGGFSTTNTGPTSNPLTVVTSTNTGTSGQASVYYLLPQSLGTTTVVASAGTAQPVSLVETSALNTSSSNDSLVVLSVISGEGQSGTNGGVLPQPFIVQATSASGQPVSTPLSLTVTEGGGAISSSSNGSFSTTNNVTTDGSSGQATIYLQPGSGPDNEVACTATAGVPQTTVYLTALTSSTSSSSPTPGGGTPPATDTDPPDTAEGGFTLTVSPKTTSSPPVSIPTTAVLQWPTLDGVESYQVQKRIDQSGAWVTISTSAEPGYNDPSVLVAGHDYQYKVEAIENNEVSATTNVSSYVVPLIKDFNITGSGFFTGNDDTGLNGGPTPTASWALTLYDWAFEQDFWGKYDYSSSGFPFAAKGVFLDENYPIGSGVSLDEVGGYDVTFQIDFNPTDPGSIPNLDWVQAHTTGPLLWYWAINMVPSGPYPYSVYLTNANAYSTQYTPMTTPVVAGGGPSSTIGFSTKLSDDSESEVYAFVPAPHLTIADGTGGYLNDADASGAGLTLTVGGSAEITSPLYNSYAPSANWNPDSLFGFPYPASSLISAATPATLTYTGPIEVLDNATREVITNGGPLIDGPNLTVIPLPTATDGDRASVTITTAAGSSNTVNFTIHTSPGGDLNVPIDEASGARYRKIALNGLPMPDEKPQQSAESDQEKEETYIDALTLGLRHATTDVYMPVSGSDFSVSARRDFRSQVWENGNGLRPHEQPDLPFGMCWSSNLAPNIKLTHNDDPSNTTPDQAIVTDETGAVHTFCRWYDASGNEQFFPMPTAKNEGQVPNLETLTANTSTYVFTRKYGATLTYQMTTLTQSISNNRLVGSPYTTTYQYARLAQAVDRVGNTINYQYQGTTNLVPETITVANQPGIELSIEQTPLSSPSLLNNTNLQGSVITAIWDANGNKTCFGYSVAPEGSDTDTVVLTSVTTPDGATTHYSYSSTNEADLTPHAPNAAVGTYTYADISSITDPLGNSYSFCYALDHSKFNYMDNPQLYVGYYIQSGCPRNITTVTMPDNSSQNPDVATFANNSKVCVKNATSPLTGLVMAGYRVNAVTDATGFTRTYTFGNAAVLPIPTFRQIGGNDTDAIIIAYQNLNVQYGTLGSETFQFNINAAMALSQITDFSGNVTTFAQTDAWSAPASYAEILANLPLINDSPLNGYYDDPTQQTDALGNSKYFTYDLTTRIMTDVVDENGNHTHYDIDSLGRRTTEKIYAPNGNEKQETDFVYGNAAYPGFMTQKTVQKLGGSDPSWVAPLVTQYVPDANGRIAQETVDPGGLNLVTAYTYDANGNKLTATDPRGDTTWFSYDTRNRLVTVTNADGTQKQMVYDARGNKSVEYDENGIATLYQYDPLNRLTAQARQMAVGSVQSLLSSSNDVNSIPSGDITTSYTYNQVNSKLSTTDPNDGVTSMAYDSLQRVTGITDALSNVTQFSYGANSGGNCFDSSSFKPTETIDPRGFATDVTYDALYRPVVKAVQYQAGTGQTPSTTTTAYDNVGNPVLTTDPLGHQTKVCYDALNRPFLTIYADSTTSHASYTSTGFKWQVIDQNGNKTQTVYDNAGRAISVTAGAGTSAAATTTTAYDAAGNVAETVNPLGHKWDYVYDARNRKLQELEPPVTDADPASSTYNTTVRPTLAWEYDPAGRVTAVIDARGNETDTFYDPANRVTTNEAPSVAWSSGGSSGTNRPTTTTTYDLDSNVLTVSDPNGHTTSNTYDALNRLVTTTDAEGITVANTWDQVGNKLTVTDGLSHTTSFTYDGLNRLLTTADPAGHVTTLKYDALNKTQRVDALGQTTTYLYDVRNRLSNVVYASTAAANSQRNYVYDSDGNLLSVTEPSKTTANVVYTYDPLNRVVSEQVADAGPSAGAVTHDYTYDAAGNRVQTVYGGTGRTITSIYDTLNRLSTMQDQTSAEISANGLAASGSGRKTTYAYDLNGNIVKKTLPNSDVESETFDALNRTEVAAAVPSGGGSLYNFTYGYDLVGNVTSVGETYPSGLNNRTVTNTYDSINRLMYEAVSGSAPNVTTAYLYDHANNRTVMGVATSSNTVTTDYTYNNLNQPTSYTNGTRSVTLTYDADGNRSTRVVTGGSDNGTDTYSYDFENRLIGLVKGTAGGAGTYAYTYDYRTRRVVRDESAAGGVVTDLVFSGGTSVQEYSGSISTTNLQVEYLRGSDYGGGVGGILYTIRGGTPSYTHANKRGDIVAKTNASGTLTYQGQYAAFGNQVATTGSTADRQKSNSKDTDPTNLVDEGMRYRDLETGEFITRDPAGFVDGPNLYTYVVQNPWTHFDPEGLATEDDYNKDIQNQQQQENKALQKYWNSTSKEKRTTEDQNKVMKPFEDNMAKDRKGIANIEATAKYFKEQCHMEIDHALNDTDSKDSAYFADASLSQSILDVSLVVGIEGPGEVSKGVSETANFAQSYFRDQFSKEGKQELTKLAGVPIKTIDDLVAAIKAGKIDPSKIPVNTITKDDMTLILNTRTSQALEKAGVPRSQWNNVDKTGDPFFEKSLQDQLDRNNLGPEGTPATLPAK